MITNPNDLFITSEEKKDFIEIIKNHIIDEFNNDTYFKKYKED